MEPNESISKLLRLKRYEQPPGEYFERFLGEFQLRQRAEVIHRPLFKVAWDRLRSAFTPPPIPRLALASSFAVAILAGTVIPAVEPAGEPRRPQWQGERHRGRLLTAGGQLQ